MQQGKDGLSGYQVPDELMTLQMKARRFGADEIVPSEAHRFQTIARLMLAE